MYNLKQDTPYQKDNKSLKWHFVRPSAEAGTQRVGPRCKHYSHWCSLEEFINKMLRLTYEDEKSKQRLKSRTEMQIQKPGQTLRQAENTQQTTWTWQQLNRSEDHLNKHTQPGRAQRMMISKQQDVKHLTTHKAGFDKVNRKQFILTWEGPLVGGWIILCWSC